MAIKITKIRGGFLLNQFCYSIHHLFHWFSFKNNQNKSYISGAWMIPIMNIWINWFTLICVFKNKNFAHNIDKICLILKQKNYLHIYQQTTKSQNITRLNQSYFITFLDYSIPYKYHSRTCCHCTYLYRTFYILRCLQLSSCFVNPLVIDCP